MKGGPIGPQNKKGHPAHFMIFAVNGRITNGLLLCHGDLPPRGVLVIVGSELKGALASVEVSLLQGNLTEPVLTYCRVCAMNNGLDDSGDP